MDATILTQRINLVGPWLRWRLGGPVVKIGLDAGLGCPNWDGTLGRAGCSFCPPNGAGRGRGGVPLADQVSGALERLAARNRPVKALAYFQAHTSTHAPADQLRDMFEQVLAFPELAGMVVSTRPDCLGPRRWGLLQELSGRTLFWLELGLQSAHDATLAALGRGHDRACFDRAAAEAHKRGIKVVAHVILGLPGEGLQHTATTARHLAGLGVWGVKLHNLMILRGARLAREYAAGELSLWSAPEYAAAVADFLARLPREMIVHRLAADPGPDELLAPDWAGNKDAILTRIADELTERGVEQGSLYGIGDH